MKKYYLGLFLFIALMFAACDQEVGEEALFIAEAPVLRLTIEENANKAVTFITRNVWFSNCPSFHHVDTQTNGNTIMVTVFGSQRKNSICPEELTEFNSQFTVNTSTAGDHLFRFRITESVTLDTMINVLD